jgi:hypothetical protein
MRLETACRPVFARHETFHPRFGWVKKAYDAAADDPDLFNLDEAVVKLGVGKNMVRSIKFWGRAFRVLGDPPSMRARLAGPSAIGRQVLADDGWDPYCEAPGTLWLLHWWLLAPPSIAPIWWLTFNEFSGVEFTAEQLVQFASDRTREWADPHPSAVKKDVYCLLRMYGGSGTARATFDDLIDCPFLELDLVRPSKATPGAYRLTIGPKPTLPPLVAAFTCLDYVARTESAARTITVSRLANEEGAPGRAFKLTEPSLIDLLSRASEHPAVELTSVAGVFQLAFDRNPAHVATELLRDHYRMVAGHDGATNADILRPIAGLDADLPLEMDRLPELLGHK